MYAPDKCNNPSLPSTKPAPSVEPTIPSLNVMSRRSALGLLSRLAAACGVAPHTMVESIVTTANAAAKTANVANPALELLNSYMEEKKTEQAFVFLTHQITSLDGVRRVGFDRDTKTWSFELPDLDRGDISKDHEQVQFNSCVCELLEFAHENLKSKQRILPDIGLLNRARDFFLPHLALPLGAEFGSDLLRERTPEGRQIDPWKRSDELDVWLDNKSSSSPLTAENRALWHNAFTKREENFQVFFQSKHFFELEQSMFSPKKPAKTLQEREARARCVFDLLSQRCVDAIETIETFDARTSCIFDRFSASDGGSILNSVFSKGLESVVGDPSFALKRRYWGLLLQHCRAGAAVSSEITAEIQAIETSLKNKGAELLHGGFQQLIASTATSTTPQEPSPAEQIQNQEVA